MKSDLETQASLKTMAPLMDAIQMPFPEPRNHAEEIENARKAEERKTNEHLGRYGNNSPS